MHIVQITSREQFIRAAKAYSAPVDVTVMPHALPVRMDGAVVAWRGALAIDYVMEFEHATMGDSRWVYREVQADPSKERLLEQLKESVPQQVRIVRRAGSLPAV